MAVRQRPTDLPDFRQPPLVEVAIGAQFEEIDGFRSIHYGAVADEFISDYAKVEDKQTLQPTFEVFGGSAIFGDKPAFRLETADYILPRLWLISENEGRIIQVQNNRFILNWKRAEEKGDYPHFEGIYDHFSRALIRFKEALERRDLSLPKMNQCEVTYVNHIMPLEEDDIWRHPEACFRRIGASDWRDEEVSGGDLRFVNRYELSRGGEAVARLVAEAQPILHNRKRSYRFVVTVRGRPEDSNGAGSEEFYFWARRKIVEYFSKTFTGRYTAAWQMLTGENADDC